MGAAQLLDRSALAGRPRAGDDQPAAGADLPPVQQGQQPALPGDLAERGGRDDHQFRVVADPGLVVGLPALRCQADGMRGPGAGRSWPVASPRSAATRQGGGGLAALIPGRCLRCAAHHQFLASSRASKTPSGHRPRPDAPRTSPLLPGRPCCRGHQAAGGRLGSRPGGLWRSPRCGPRPCGLSRTAFRLAAGTLAGALMSASEQGIDGLGDLLLWPWLRHRRPAACGRGPRPFRRTAPGRWTGASRRR